MPWQLRILITKRGEIPAQNKRIMSINYMGCTTCYNAGSENYERFRNYKGKYQYQYDYRHTNGELFSCIADTLEQCRNKRDAWVSNKG